jgi:hypothetical protein
MEDEEALSAYGMGKQESQSHPLFAVPLSAGAHRAQLRKSRERNGMVASAPRVDMGPGPPATACRKCRTATSHDEHSLESCLG